MSNPEESAPLSIEDKLSIVQGLNEALEALLDEIDNDLAEEDDPFFSDDDVDDFPPGAAVISAALVGIAAAFAVSVLVIVKTIGSVLR